MSNKNQSSSFSSDISNYIASKVLPLARRQVVAYQFGNKLELGHRNGTTYTASRFDRLNLPYQPLQEGVPSAGESMPLAQVSATAQQWGDSVYITDVAELTIKHSLWQQAMKLTAMQLTETLERNTFNNLMGGTNINYAGSVANRAALASANTLSAHEINRAVGSLLTYGAPRFDGDSEETAKVDAKAKPRRVSPHYVAIIHPLVAQDLREDSKISNAWTYSDVNMLYNQEVGEWNGVRFTESNMVPTFTGAAAIAGTGSTTGGSLAAGTYYVQVTAMNTLTGVEDTIYQVSASITTTGSTSSISVTLPSLSGHTFNVYIGTTASPSNLGACASGPASGPMAGQAYNLSGGTSAVITALGTSQTPPAAPATGVTVYPTFVLGREAYGIVMLDNAKFEYLKNADKSDPHNQLRVISWKIFYGTILLNQNFFKRIESASAFAA